MSQQTGKHYEQLATKFLRQRGLKILTQNYRCKMGEIDIIGHDQQMLVFIEVKYRHSDQYGKSIEMVTRSKQDKLLRTAQYYLLQNPHWQSAPCRFDLIAIQDQPKLSINWIENAFC